MAALFRVSNRAALRAIMACVPTILAGRIDMDHRLKSYLRTFRRRFGFTQKELAFLIGISSRTAVSRIEQSKRKPSIEALIVSVFIFGASPVELFPALISDLHVGVLERANELYEELQGEPSRTTRAKLDFLERLLNKTEQTDLNTSA
jgi:transcriptional regulator with XRE-family HTH domain